MPRAQIPAVLRFWSKVKKTSRCWLWTGAKRGRGYGVLRRGSADEGFVDSHRFSYEIHFGPVPEDMWVLHHCDNPSCIRPSHIYAGTPKQNNQDMVFRGRSIRGESHANSRLTFNQVKIIRSEYIPHKIFMETFAKRFRVSVSTIQRVISKESWNHI